MYVLPLLLSCSPAPATKHASMRANISMMPNDRTARADTVLTADMNDITSTTQAQGSSPTKQHNRRPYSASASSGESTPRPAWGAGQGGTKKTKKTKGLGSGRLTPSRTKAATVDESLFGMTGIVAGSSGAGAGAGTDTQATASGSSSPAAWPTTQRTNRTPRATRSRTTRPATTAGTGRGR